MITVFVRMFLGIIIAIAHSGGLSAGERPCDHECQLQVIANAKSVVMYHVRGPIPTDIADELTKAVRRKVRVEAFVGQPNETYGDLSRFMEGYFSAWNKTASDEDTTLLGMGACILALTDSAPFLVSDPFRWVDGEHPALVQGGVLEDDYEKVSEFANIVDTEDFIQCKLD